jgi:chromosome segregation ATPase
MFCFSTNKGILADKDMRIQEQQEQILQMRDQLIAANMDSEKASVAALSKALEERDKQIATLRRQLEEATEGMHEDAAMMAEIRNEMTKCKS